ncbi:MAG: SDR family oxidoreductase [Planctomycetes bacterium]|nr:SDR family oxidoreductase [Planctomycetota bacterium]
METESITAVVTGASGCVGGAIAVALSRAGCRCVCHYHHNEAPAKKIVEKIIAQGGRAVAVKADLTDTDDISRLFDAYGEFGPPRILVNSAAIFKRGAISEITAENARQMLDIDLVSPILVSAAFAESVKGLQVTGNIPVAKIVNLVDIGGIRPWANYTMYCAAKAGLIAATKSMAKELAPAVCVNAVAPGVVSWPDDVDKEEYDRQVSMIPAQRVGTPEEIAAAVVFLIKNDYITGQILNVDGGRCM